jgi:hypothetical protein
MEKLPFELPNLTSEHEYSIQEDSANGIVLMKDKNQVFCHRVQPIPTQGAIAGQVSFFRFPCCTNCGKAEVLKDENNDLFYVVSCDGTKQEFKLKSPKPKATLISL